MNILTQKIILIVIIFIVAVIIGTIIGCTICHSTGSKELKGGPKYQQVYDSGFKQGYNKCLEDFKINIDEKKRDKKQTRRNLLQ